MNAREKHLQEEEERLELVTSPFNRDESEASRRARGEAPPVPWYARKERTKQAPRPFKFPQRKAS